MKKIKEIEAKEFLGIKVDMSDIYNRIDLKQGDEVMIYMGNRGNSSFKDKIKWKEAIVLKRYPLYVLFEVEDKYTTTFLNVDIYFGFVKIRKISNF